MATQTRSWLARVGVVAIVAVGALVGVSTPTLAAPSDAEAVDINLESPVAPGSNATLSFKIKNKGAASFNFTISVDTASPIVAECTGSCSKQVEVGGGQTSGNQTFTLAAKNGGAGQGVNIRIKSSGQEIASRTLNVQAAQPQQQFVGKIQGTVKNIADAKPVKNAIVTLVDGAGKSHQTTADGNGIFTFDADKKIAPGVVAISATKAPFQMAGGIAKTVTMQANQQYLPLDLLMEDPAAASPTPTPLDTAVPTDTASPADSAVPVGEDAPADEGGMDSMTLVMIIVGGLLVALGIGAIVLLLVRRNNDDEEEEDDEQPARGRPGPRGPQGAPQSGGGAYRPTSPAGYGQPGYGTRGADPTMVANQYGVPQQRGPQPGGAGYGAPTQQWNPQQGGPGYGGPPSSGGGYGQPGYGQGQGPYEGGGYGGPPQSGGGYGQPGYGGGQYDETTHYAGPTSGSGGYGQQAAYGQGPASGGGYGQPGYVQGAGAGGGYDANGYGQQQGGGYGNDAYGQDPYGGGQQAGYGQSGYGDDRRNRGDRRLDWLDD